MKRLLELLLSETLARFITLSLIELYKFIKKMILQLIQGQDHLYHTPCKPPYTHSWQRFPHVSYMLLLKLYKKCVI